MHEQDVHEHLANLSKRTLGSPPADTQRGIDLVEGGVGVNPVATHKGIHS